MKYISETLAKVKNAVTKAEKIKILRSNDDKTFHSFLEFILNPEIKTHFDKIPDYRPLKGPVDLGMIPFSEAFAKSYLFVVNHPKSPAQLTSEKREILLVQQLEALSADDAKYYGMMITKTLPNEINRGLIKEALGIDFK